MRMSLKQKGAIRPPPVLRHPFERVSKAIQQWPDVIAATHWHLLHHDEVDGADFYLGDAELGHLHLDGKVHLATTPALRRPLVAAELARRFTFGGYGGWVEASIRNDVEAEHALWLFRLNYDRLRGASATELLNRIAERVDVSCASDPSSF